MKISFFFLMFTIALNSFLAGQDSTAHATPAKAIDLTYDRPAEEKAALERLLNEHRTCKFKFVRFLPGVPKSATPKPEHVLVAVSQCLRGNDPRSVVQYVVLDSGDEFDCRNIYDYAIQATHVNQIPAERMALISKELQNCSVLDDGPQDSEMVIISFQKDSKWITLNKTAASIRPLLKAIGKRPEVALR